MTGDFDSVGGRKAFPEKMMIELKEKGSKALPTKKWTRFQSREKPCVDSLWWEDIKHRQGVEGAGVGE